MKKRYFAIVIGAMACVVLGFTVSSVAQRGSSNQAFFATLTGANELDEDNDRGAGDRNGRGAFSAIFDGRQLCYGIQVKNIGDPSAAHIHRARSNRNGPVVVPLETPDGGDQGTSSACTRLSSRLARSIQRNPGSYYVNVHNADFPNGAVRGQLFGRAR
ncbi:MAG: CHRD domain-containing protein [Thermoleophilaceae bacterium]